MPWRANKLQPFSLQDSNSEVNSDAGSRSLFGSTLNDNFDDAHSDSSRHNPVGLEGRTAVDDRNTCGASRSLPGAKRLAKGVTVDDSKYAHMLARAFISCKDADEFLFPWEYGHLKPFFQRDSECNDIDKSWLSVKADWVGLDWPSEPAEQQLERFGPQPGVDGVLHTKAIMAMPDKTFAEQNSMLSNLAVSKWVSVISACLLASETGRLIINLGSVEAQKEGMRRIIQSIIGTRSAKTACTRANSMLAFMRWAYEEFPDLVQPFEEDRVWKYLCHLQDTGAAPTKGSSFISACRYSHFVFGFECLSQVHKSQRIQGVANLMYVGKRPLKQCLVLTVEQVKTLHRMVTDSSLDDVDSAISAYVLIALYGRCRHSDLGLVHDIVHDHDETGGFCEIRTTHHKTARTVSLQATLLPIILPGLSVMGTPWIGEVRAALERIGLVCEGLLDGPIFRPPSKWGLCERGISSAEVTKFLRLCFETGGPVTDAASRDGLSLETEPPSSDSSLIQSSSTLFEPSARLGNVATGLKYALLGASGLNSFLEMARMIS